MEFVQNANNYITVKIKFGVLDFKIKPIRSILCEVRGYIQQKCTSSFFQYLGRAIGINTSSCFADFDAVQLSNSLSFKQATTIKSLAFPCLELEGICESQLISTEFVHNPFLYGFSKV